MDIFETKNVSPMLIGEIADPFDSPEFIYELKVDGERCVAFIDSNGVDLRNKRNVKMLGKFPELSQLHKQVGEKCILDGELFVIKDGKPEFFEVQRRSLMTDKFKIELAAKMSPASFYAFDVLYFKNNMVTDKPLFERKELLSGLLTENEKISMAQFIENNGVAFYNAAESQKLEGVVAKRKNSKYYFGKRTKEWIKIKYLKDDDFVICGYIDKGSKFSLVLGQFSNGRLKHKGHVTMGVSRSYVETLLSAGRSSTPTVGGEKYKNTVWLQPKMVGVVQWMPRSNDGLNQAVFKGLRDDKEPSECIEKET